MIVLPGRAWTLERNDRRLEFVRGSAAFLFAESAPFAVTRHRHPAWKVVLPLGGRVEVRPHGAAAGVIVPPQFDHTCAVSSGYVALFLEPWQLAPADGPIPLGPAEVGRVLAALGGTGAGADLEAAVTEISALAGPGAALEPRVARAVDRLGFSTSIGDVATDVGLSTPRLRTLVRDSIGIPLTRLRQWAKLRVAVTDIAHNTAAVAAADAGFADQAHLTRTARRLLGRTPGELLR